MVSLQGLDLLDDALDSLARPVVVAVGLVVVDHGHEAGAGPDLLFVVEAVGEPHGTGWDPPHLEVGLGPVPVEDLGGVGALEKSGPVEDDPFALLETADEVRYHRRQEGLLEFGAENGSGGQPGILVRELHVE